MEVATVVTESVSIEQTTEIPSKKIQNETTSMHPSDTPKTTGTVGSQSIDQTIDLQTVPAMEQLTIETTNDLSAGNSQERVNTNEILVPQQQENEMTGSHLRCFRSQKRKKILIFSIDQTASMIAKRYTTEDQAKAALAERRRIAREEAEKLAELERQRKEAEELAEQQRIADEEENQRRLEEETLRLVDEQKKAEELRLLQAIEVRVLFSS